MGYQGTCAEACWYAKEMTCACQCDGKNHGILLGSDGEKPKRTKRIKGTVLEMHSIHSSYSAAGKARHESVFYDGQWHFEIMAEIQTVYADKCKWPEVEPFYDGPWRNAYIVWVGTKSA